MAFIKRLLLKSKNLITRGTTLKYCLNSNNNERYNIITQLENSFKSNIENGLVVAPFQKALLYHNKTAVEDSFGKYSYLQLYLSSKLLSAQISNICGSASSSPVAYVCEHNTLWIVALWSCWMSGQVAVPLKCNYSYQLLENLVHNSETKLIISTPKFEPMVQSISARYDVAYLIIDHSFLIMDEISLPQFKKLFLISNESVTLVGTPNNDFYTNSNALLLYYTSAGTCMPQKMIFSYKDIENEIEKNLHDWIIKPSATLHLYPQINPLFDIICILSHGGKVIILDNYNIQTVWTSLLNINDPMEKEINIFVAAPKVYYLIITEFEKIFGSHKNITNYVNTYFKTQFRFMIYNHSSLPISIINRWYEITGNKLHVCNFHNIIKLHDLSSSKKKL